MKNIFIIIVLSLFSTNTFAGDSQGKIGTLMVHTGDVVMFSAGVHNNRPACSSSQWALSLKTETGKAMYAMLLSASAQGQTVKVKGNNKCSAWGDRETPVYMWVVN